MSKQDPHEAWLKHQKTIEDKALMADLYLNLKRCKGGRVIVENYCCPHCGSSDPSSDCSMEKQQ